MNKDWTDIIGQELEKFEEPLPADDWRILQQKLTILHRRRKVLRSVFAGGITSIAAVFVILFIVQPEQSASDCQHIVENLICSPIIIATPPMTETSVVTTPDKKEKEIVTDEFISICDYEYETNVQSSTDDSEHQSLIAENASPGEIALNEITLNEFALNEFPEEKSEKHRKKISIGLSGRTSGVLVYNKMGIALNDNTVNNQIEQDSTRIDGAVRSKKMSKTKKSDTAPYDHDMPITIGLSARFHIINRLTLNTGLNYTRYSSTIHRKRQHVHYIGIPIRLDWMVIERKYLDFYLGGGAQADKCIHATLGGEQIHEKKILFSANISAGLQLNLTPSLGLYLEPDIAYNLNKGSLQTLRTEEATSISSRIGLRFNF